MHCGHVSARQQGSRIGVRAAQHESIIVLNLLGWVRCENSKVFTLKFLVLHTHIICLTVASLTIGRAPLNRRLLTSNALCRVASAPSANAGWLMSQAQHALMRMLMALPLMLRDRATSTQMVWQHCERAAIVTSLQQGWESGRHQLSTSASPCQSMLAQETTIEPRLGLWMYI